MKWWNLASCQNYLVWFIWLVVVCSFFYISCGLHFERRYVKVPHLTNVNETANLLSAEFLTSLRKKLFPVRSGLSEEAVPWDLDGSSSQQGLII